MLKIVSWCNVKKIAWILLIKKVLYNIPILSGGKKSEENRTCWVFPFQIFNDLRQILRWLWDEFCIELVEQNNTESFQLSMVFSTVLSSCFQTSNLSSDSRQWTFDVWHAKYMHSHFLYLLLKAVFSKFESPDVSDLISLIPIPKCQKYVTNSKTNADSL